MHFRVSTSRRRGKLYRYGQLVESYRRDDGMPAHRVVASLGRLTEQEAANLKLAFQASKRGQAVVVVDEVARRLAVPRPSASRLYLPAALLLALWERWGMDELVEHATGQVPTEVPVASVVAALVLQRCIEPGSKLAAVDWFPTTALPELLDLPPHRFNNTRIHRTLDLIEQAEAPLQERLARTVAADRGRFVALFLDCTDTWFEGRGPEMASLRRTKESLLRRRIGIALMCDEQGFPLRWATVPGAHDEARTMLDVVRQVAELSWTEGVPIVMDRAMGYERMLQALSELDVRFVTAIRASSFASYSSRIPLSSFDDVELTGDAEHDLSALGARAADLGFTRGSDGRHLLDLGVFAKGADTNQGVVRAHPHSLSRARAVLSVAQRLVAAGQLGTSLDSLSQRSGVPVHMLRHWRRFASLAPAVLERIHGGEADRVTPKALQTLLGLPEQEQVVEFERLCDEHSDGPVLYPTRKLESFIGFEPLALRGVVIFSPDQFLSARAHAQDSLQRLQLFVAELNERLLSASSRRSMHDAFSAVCAELHRMQLAAVCNVSVELVEVDDRSRPRVRLDVDEAVWRRRRRADGINLIVGDRRFVGSAEELVRLYFAKDKVEKDFRTIKSVLELRPVHHRTDPKVRAHVSLCMLALLLERSLDSDLREAGMGLSAPAALRTLAPCMLNQYDHHATTVYATTTTTPDQQRILAALGLEQLVDDRTVAQRIRPR